MTCSAISSSYQCTCSALHSLPQTTFSLTVWSIPLGSEPPSGCHTFPHVWSKPRRKRPVPSGTLGVSPKSTTPALRRARKRRLACFNPFDGPRVRERQQEERPNCAGGRFPTSQTLLPVPLPFLSRRTRHWRRSMAKRRQGRRYRACPWDPLSSHGFSLLFLPRTVLFHGDSAAWTRASARGARG